MLSRADKLGAKVALILGDDEIGGNVVQVKNLAAQTQDRVPRDRAVAAVDALLRASGGSAVT
jgi:histidyl-tRNA synthetase